MVKLYPEYFNDVFGPITQPGSSSHMAGPCRAGYLAHSLLGERVKEIRIYLDREGSFYDGFGQMNEDLGMLNGAFGNLPQTKGFFQIKDKLKQEGIPFSFTFTELTESKHPNCMKFVLTGTSGKEVSLVANSIGGGMVETVTVNGFPYQGKGDAWNLFFFGEGTEGDARSLSERLGRETEILFEGSAKSPDGSGVMLWFQVEKKPDQKALEELWPGAQVAFLEPILPVPTTASKKEQKFTSMQEWREIARAEGKTMFDVAVEYEMDASGWTREQVIDFMSSQVQTALERRIHALYEDESLLVVNPFRTIFYKEWEQATKEGHLVSGVTKRAIHYMHSAQAQMTDVLDVPGPMSNGGGYLYSVLSAVKEEYRLSQEDLLRGLFIAAAVGAIAYTRSEPTGEIIGCAGECGICAAMTAAAIVEMLGGSPEHVENAAALTLQAAIGWPCDPIPGGQGTPCTARTLFIVSMPQVYAQWAMMGGASVIPFHEVLDTVDKVGRSMPPELLCTSRGGLCATKSAKECIQCFKKARAEK